MSDDWIKRVYHFVPTSKTYVNWSRANGEVKLDPVVEPISKISWPKASGLRPGSIMIDPESKGRVYAKPIQVT